MPADKKKNHIPVFDYRGSKFGIEVTPSKVHGQPKCQIDGKGGCKPLDGTPMMKEKGLHGGVWKDDGTSKGMIVYH